MYRDAFQLVSTFHLFQRIKLPISAKFHACITICTIRLFLFANSPHYRNIDSSTNSLTLSSRFFYIFLKSNLSCKTRNLVEESKDVLFTTGSVSFKRNRCSRKGIDWQGRSTPQLDVGPNQEVPSDFGYVFIDLQPYFIFLPVQNVVKQDLSFWRSL